MSIEIVALNRWLREKIWTLKSVKRDRRVIDILIFFRVVIATRQQISIIYIYLAVSRWAIRLVEDEKNDDAMRRRTMMRWEEERWCDEEKNDDAMRRRTMMRWEECRDSSRLQTSKRTWLDLCWLIDKFRSSTRLIVTILLRPYLNSLSRSYLQNVQLDDEQALYRLQWLDSFTNSSTREVRVEKRFDAFLPLSKLCVITTKGLSIESRQWEQRWETCIRVLTKLEWCDTMNALWEHVWSKSRIISHYFALCQERLI